MRAHLDTLWSREQNRLILWAPALLGIGIGSYFFLSSEPSKGTLLLIGFGAFVSIALIFYVKNFVARISLTALVLILGGFITAYTRAHMLGTPMLQKPFKGCVVQGKITALTRLYSKNKNTVRGMRLVIKLTQPLQKRVPSAQSAAPPALKNVQLWLPKEKAQLQVGQHIYLKATLRPFPAPTWPYGHNTRREAYFRGVGAKGFALTDPVITHTPRISTWKSKVTQWRTHINQTLHAQLPPPLSSVGAALLTGDTGSLPQQVRANFASAGIAHLLAISGLHMSIVAGFLFFLVQRLLSLWQRAALFLPLHKIAALLTILGTFFYLHISGCHIPALRAFIMTSLAMIALMADRSPFSLRLVAFAAIGILIARPENLLSVSFQLSFAAVTALIASFEHLRPWIQRWHAPTLRRKIFLGLSLSLGSTFVAGVATTPFTVATFHQATCLGMIANLVAIPLTTFWIMPVGFVSLLAVLLE